MHKKKSTWSLRRHAPSSSALLCQRTSQQLVCLMISVILRTGSNQAGETLQVNERLTRSLFVLQSGHGEIGEIGTQFGVGVAGRNCLPCVTNHCAFNWVGRW